MTYTVKQLADLAGVSPRTLHYYDEIDLLSPSSVGSNGYRQYDTTAVIRLQQILFYKELGLSLKEIKALLDTPNFDELAALEAHKSRLEQKAGRILELLDTTDPKFSAMYRGFHPNLPEFLFQAIQHYVRSHR